MGSVCHRTETILLATKALEREMLSQRVRGREGEGRGEGKKGRMGIRIGRLGLLRKVCMSSSCIGGSVKLIDICHRIPILDTSRR